MTIIGSIESLEEFRRRHPGRDPDPVRDLAGYLSGRFSSGLPLRITTWKPDATGQQLSEHFVSRLEVVNAMRYLPNHLWEVVDALFVRRLTADEAAEELGISLSTVWRRRIEAVRGMVPRIYEGGWLVGMLNKDLEGAA